jgi:hypothetical protein
MKLKYTKQPYADVFLRIFEALGHGHAGKKLLKQDLLMTFPYVGDTIIPVGFDPGSEHPDAEFMIKKVQELIRKVKFLEDKLTPSISINTFFTFFQFIARTGIDEDVRDDDLRSVIEKANKLFVAEWKNACKALTNVVFGALSLSCDFRKALYAFDYEEKRRTKMGCSFRIVLYKVDPVVMEFELDGVVRKAYRVGRCGNGRVVKWSQYNFQGRQYPIYVQSHAIEALEKRIDTTRISILFFHLAHSLEKPELRYYKKKYLLTYRISNTTKVGYFVCSFVSGCLVLRTFLFITYDGTPEGDLLNDKLELDKQSKAYMGLEKYSTFEMALNDDDLKGYLPELNLTAK